MTSVSRDGVRRDRYTIVFIRAAALIADPPYNYAFVQSIDRPLYMHLRIYPKPGFQLSFEPNTGVHINSVPPAAAAKSLREVGP